MEAKTERGSCYKLVITIIGEYMISKFNMILLFLGWFTLTHQPVRYTSPKEDEHLLA